MKRLPAIKSVMTPFPYSVDVDAPVSEAQQFMRGHNIRHLPVTEQGKLLGVISDRDVKLYLGPDFDYPDADKARVRDVLVEEPYVVDLNERLDLVLREMARRHIGSVLVTRNGRLAGVFTVTDACRSFADWLCEGSRPPGGDEAA